MNFRQNCLESMRIFLAKIKKLVKLGETHDLRVKTDHSLMFGSKTLSMRIQNVLHMDWFGSFVKYFLLRNSI